MSIILALRKQDCEFETTLSYKTLSPKINIFMYTYSHMHAGMEGGNLAKWLLCKQEDLNSPPPNVPKKPGVAANAYNPSTGGRGEGGRQIAVRETGSRHSLADNIARAASSRVSERPRLRKKKKKGGKQWKTLKVNL